MATRFYLTQITAPFIPAFNSNWNITSAVSSFVLSEYRDKGAAQNYSSGAAGAAAPRKMLIAQFVSPPLVSQVLNGTFYGQIRMARSGGTVTAYGIIYLRKISAAGVITELGSIDSQTVLAITPLVNHTFSSITLSSVTINGGDRLIIEVGGDYTVGTAVNLTSTLQLQTNSATDLPVDNTSTTSLSTWVEFSQTLFLQQQANLFI